MFELVRKEIKGFFASLSGYVILFIFLITCGLFLWVIPGNDNIPDSGLADMQSFFALAPLLYLFLVPALCMRLFAEERRTGTLELLFTRPLSAGQIVLAKYLAGFLLVLLSILPTLIYPVSLWLLAQPAGHIDTGGIAGSYIGLVFLSGIYVAIGIWASARTDNQVVAFLYALVICFLLYTGLDLIGAVPFLADYQAGLQYWGIARHYEPMSRGVIALADVVWFVSFIGMILGATVRRFVGKTRSYRWIWVLSGFVVLNLLFTRVYVQADITADQRYTLSPHTLRLMKQIDRPIEAEIFLAGKLPPGMQKLQYALTRMLEEFRRISGNRIRYRVVDPADIEDPEEKKALVKYLAERGIMPVNLNRRTEDETLSQQIIFPGVVVYDGKTEVSVRLLQQVPGLGAEENINHSIEALEYELTHAVRLLMRKELKSVAWLTGHGELPYEEVMDFAKTLAYYYQVDFVETDSLAADLQRYKALIVARPVQPFSEHDKYVLDQYVMHGGRILWCVDEVDVQQELLKEQETVPAVYRPLNIEDLLFRYGVRLNPDLVLDGNCALIPVVTGMQGNTPRYSPGNWYYSPLLLPAFPHPVTAGIQPVRVDYANSIDTVGGKEDLKKTVLLATSRYAAALKTPCPVTLAIMEEKMTPEKFNRQFLPVAMALEGNFPSLFRYRNTPDVGGLPFRAESGENRMVVIADGDIIRNKVRGVGEEIRALPLGYDEYSGKVFGNKDFLLNTVNWLCDDEGWMDLRSRNLSLYLLDKTRLKAERTRWQLLNLLLPLVWVGAVGGLAAWRRKKREKQICGRRYPGTLEPGRTYPGTGRMAV